MLCMGLIKANGKAEVNKKIYPFPLPPCEGRVLGAQLLPPEARQDDEFEQFLHTRRVRKAPGMRCQQRILRIFHTFFFFFFTPCSN